MILTVVGASGRSGVPLVQRALEEGYEVRALVRSESKLRDVLGGIPPGVEVVEGDATDPATARRAVAGADAVISVIGHAPGAPDDVQTRATEALIAAMEAEGVERFVSLTGAGVRDPRDEPKIVDRVFGVLLRLFARRAAEDAEAHAERIRASDLDWTIVRGPRLTDGERTGDYRFGYVGADSGIQISRADLADALLEVTENGDWSRAAPTVWS